MARYVVGWFTSDINDYEIIHECSSFSECCEFLKTHFRWMAEDWPELADQCWALAQEFAGSDLTRHLKPGGRFHVTLGDHTYYIAKPDQMDPHGGLF